MSFEMVIVSAAVTVFLVLVFRNKAKERILLLDRVAELEERLSASVAESQRASENITVVQRLLLVKGVADVEDFEAVQRADKIEFAANANQRAVH